MGRSNSKGFFANKVQNCKLSLFVFPSPLEEEIQKFLANICLFVSTIRCKTARFFFSHLPLLDRHVNKLPPLHYLQTHVALPHEEELLPLLHVVVLANVGAAQEEHLCLAKKIFK